jgi:LemA protein
MEKEMSKGFDLGLGSFGITLLVVAGVLLMWAVGIYNLLVRKRIRVEEAWADIDVQLKRRYDLVPNLVEAVKGYANHESETLIKVMDARAQASAMNIDASQVTMEQMAAFSGAQGGLTSGLGKLLAVAEDYPDLKANENFLKLQDELADVEDKIQAARRFFNSTVQEYNTQIEIFPSSMISNIFKFVKSEFFELSSSDPAKENVEVKF